MNGKTSGQIAYEAAAVITGYKLDWENANKKKWEFLADAVIERCAEVADEWGKGRWHVQQQGRVRFSLQDLQTQTNVTGRGIAEDIRALKYT